MTGGTFLTEVNIVEEFRPPQNSGLKLRVPPLGEKELVFPDVKPRTYAQTDDDYMFGFPKFGYSAGKKKSQFSFRHLRSRNLLHHDPIHSDELQEYTAKQLQQALQQRMDNTQLTQRRKVDSSPRRRGNQTPSVASSMTHTTIVTPHPPEAAPATLNAVVSHSPAKSAVSFCSRSTVSSRSAVPSYRSGQMPVSPEMYEGLVSVSQVASKGGSVSASSAKSRSSAVHIAALEGVLAEERAHRESAEKRLQQLQDRQEQLMKRLAEAGIS